MKRQQAEEAAKQKQQVATQRQQQAPATDI